MLPAGLVPDWLFTAVAAATVFTIMFDLGLAIRPGEFRWVLQQRQLLGKALFAALVAVPAVAWVLMRAFDLPRQAEVGIMLMAISPGAPVALRRSLGAGGHPSFAPALQIGLAVLAVVTMPLWLTVFNEYYAGTATIDSRQLARQVFIAQLLPLGLGMAARRVAPDWAAKVEPRLRKAGGVLLLALVLLALVDIWRPVVKAGPLVALAIALVTTFAIAVGHLVAGPAPATRTATAISSAARNPGLALLVAQLNHASTGVTATVLAYLVISALTLIPYAVW
jgi:predicted Na+-dependent transporter